MAAYATIEDVQARMLRELSEKERTVATNLLDDIGVTIDAYNANASAEAKKIVSCNAVKRALGNGDSDVPIRRAGQSVPADL